MEVKERDPAETCESSRCDLLSLLCFFRTHRRLPRAHRAALAANNSYPEAFNRELWVRKTESHPSARTSSEWLARLREEAALRCSSRVSHVARRTAQAVSESPFSDPAHVAVSANR